MGDDASGSGVHISMGFAAREQTKEVNPDVTQECAIVIRHLHSSRLALACRAAIVVTEAACRRQRAEVHTKSQAAW